MNVLSSFTLHKTGRPRIYGLLWLQDRRLSRRRIHVGIVGSRLSLCKRKFAQAANAYAFADITCLGCLSNLSYVLRREEKEKRFVRSPARIPATNA